LITMVKFHFCVEFCTTATGLLYVFASFLVKMMSYI
jgi:hypothetical protein